MAEQPRSVLREQARWVMAYQNYDDDEAYVPVAEEPDIDDAAQRYANETGLLVVLEDRRRVKTQDCECVPMSDHCAEDGQPCHSEVQECWVLTTFDDTHYGRRDELRDRQDRKDKRVWEPVQRLRVAPTSVGGSND